MVGARQRVVTTGAAGPQYARRALEAVLTFSPEDAEPTRLASINWRLIVTFGSSVVHLHITLDS
jgi:hypothetical protein